MFQSQWNDVSTEAVTNSICFLIVPIFKANEDAHTQKSAYNVLRLYKRANWLGLLLSNNGVNVINSNFTCLPLSAMLSKHSRYAKGMELTHTHFITDPILRLGSSLQCRDLAIRFWIFPFRSLPAIESLCCLKRASRTIWIILSKVFWDSILQQLIVAGQTTIDINQFGFVFKVRLKKWSRMCGGWKWKLNQDNPLRCHLLFWWWIDRTYFVFDKQTHREIERKRKKIRRVKA